MEQKIDTTQVSLINLLLRPEAVNVQKQLRTQKVKMRRLSQALGCDVIFTIRGLPYSRVIELREQEDTGLHVVLAGLVDPDLKHPELKEKFGGLTPAETLKAMLLPGEIEELSRAIERLCGYRAQMVEEVKND